MIEKRFINKKYAVNNIVSLNIEESATCIGDTIVMHCVGHNLRKGDTIYFYRMGDPDTFFKDTYVVMDIIDNDHFSINYGLEKFTIYPTNAELVEDQLYANESGDTYLCLTFNNKHICSNYVETLNIKDSLLFDYTNGDEKYVCKRSGYYLYNSKTLYYVDSIDENGKHVLKKPVKNSTELLVTCNLIGETIEVGKAFVPYTSSGYPDLTKMYFNVNENTQEILDNYQTLFFECIDCRFFDVESFETLSNSDIFKLHQNCVVRTFKNEMHINLGLLSDDSFDLNKEELSNEYIKANTSNRVNKILDYEKVMFEPVWREQNEEGAILKDVKKIRFNLFLRERNFDKDTGEWYVPDENGWNSLKKSLTTNNKMVFDNELKNNKKGDLLGSIGFTDDDVLNQSNRLAKTFIRLSFYDTPNRATQTLFYYSTIFINTSKQYAKYMRNISSEVNNNISYVDKPNDDDELALCCNFECFNKYNMSGSSEGFYLYMFPNIVNGLDVTTMYMKVELNHSLYGKTIPLICPKNEKDKFDLPQLHYEYTDSTSGRYTNLNQLYKDMYIEVKLKYDKENNRYIWYIPGTDNGEININLYEPRIINTDTIK